MVAVFPIDNLRKWTTVLILAVANALSAMDRLLPAILLDPIKHSLRLSDTQVSVLTGVSFSICYAVVTLPMSWLADYGSRRRLIVGAIIAWSMMALFCGYATSYAGLIVGRMGVGVAEAALVPCGLSLISDLFPRDRRTVPLMVFVLGAGLGGALALMLGGYLSTQLSQATLLRLHLAEGWRAAFVAVGAIGPIVAMLALMLAEPPRSAEPGRSRHHGLAGAARPVLTYIRSAAFLFVPLIIGLTLLNMVSAGTSAWLPTFFMRTYGWSGATVGATYGIAQIIATLAGIPAGGLIADWANRSRKGDSVVLLVGTSGIIAALSVALASIAPSGYVALVVLTIGQFFMGCASGVIPGTFLNVTPSRLRGRISGCYFCIVNILAVGCGPTLFALVTDHVLGDPRKLNQALGGLSLILGIMMGTCLIIALRRYPLAVALAAAADREEASDKFSI